MNPRLRSEGATWWTQGSLFQNGGEPRFASGRGARNFSWLRAGAITKKQHGGPTQPHKTVEIRGSNAKLALKVPEGDLKQVTA